MRDLPSVHTPSIRAVHLGAVAALLLGAGVGIGAAQQGTGSISGRVLDPTTKRSLVGAQVLVAGTTHRVFSDVKGEFRLSDLPAGEVQIRARLIGYGTAAKAVTVSAGQTTTTEIELTPTPVALEEIIVTATGEQRSREEGNAVQKLDAAKVVQQATPNTLTDLLNARAPGVEVLSSGGTTGSGTRVRIRGSNSVTLSNEPVLIVDGIRVENGAASASVGVDRKSTRLNSSHSQISYAVFCLKKKNNEPWQRHSRL